MTAGDLELKEREREALTAIIGRGGGWEDVSELNEKNFRERRKNILEYFKHDNTGKRALDSLEERGLVRKVKEGYKETYYEIPEDYRFRSMRAAYKGRDKRLVESFDNDEIIHMGGRRRKTVNIYGLPSHIFRRTEEENILVFSNKEETYKLREGIEARELLGDDFGTPPGVASKNSLEETTNDEIIESQVEYYKSRFEEGANFENILRRIIKRHRNERIKYHDVGENLVNKLTELWRNYCKKELKERMSKILEGNPEDTPERWLQQDEIQKVKSKIHDSDCSEDIEEIIKEFGDYLAGVIFYNGSDKERLKNCIFVRHGYGVGGYDMSPPDVKSKSEKTQNFKDALKEIDYNGKETLLDILWAAEREYLHRKKLAFVAGKLLISGLTTNIPLTRDNLEEES